VLAVSCGPAKSRIGNRAQTEHGQLQLGGARRAHTAMELRPDAYRRQQLLDRLLAIMLASSIVTMSCTTEKEPAGTVPVHLTALPIAFDKMKCRLRWGSDIHEVTGPHLRECQLALKELYADTELERAVNPTAWPPSPRFEYYDPESGTVLVTLTFHGMTVRDTGRYPVDLKDVGRVYAPRSVGRRLSPMSGHFNIGRVPDRKEEE